MTCYNPIHACYSKSKYAKTGKKDLHLVLVENLDEKGNPIKDSKWIINEQNYPHYLYEYIKIPCKKCVGCRSDNARMWSLRAYHEMKLHKNNCFITLTYNENNPLVENDPLCLVSLRYKHFQNFIKRLRKRFPDHNIRYIVSGEYGIENGRSHWHAILFGFDFPDKVEVYRSKGYPHYESQILNELWSVYDVKTDAFIPIGYTDLALCDYDCCSYVSQYVLKKLDVLNIEPIVDYRLTDNKQYEPIPLANKCPPIIKTSKNPAIGLEWYNKYGKNAVESGFCVNPKKNRGKIKVPSYYYDKFEKAYPCEFKKLKEERTEKMKKFYKLHPVTQKDLDSQKEAHLNKLFRTIKKSLTFFK